MARRRHRGNAARRQHAREPRLERVGVVEGVVPQHALVDVRAAVAQALSKPEAYVAICVTDNCDGMSFGGTMDPCAVGCVYSIGQINQENNAALTAAVSVLLEKHGGVANNRIYINFFDVPRANCGWSGRTFAG